MAKRKQQAAELPLVAIDLGSSGVRAMAASRIGTDILHILAVEQSTKFPCTDRGVVVQTSNAGFMIGEVLRLMANRLNLPDLPTAFVLLGGKSMQIAPVLIAMFAATHCRAYRVGEYAPDFRIAVLESRENAAV
ncbi:MAG: hypothetical protein IJ882_05695, partial [Paludibacteraceae bacterium]|nr:hypothetical protein [Paludibacteraceae bacterium]